jgi:hypothetical protein
MLQLPWAGFNFYLLMGGKDPTTISAIDLQFCQSAQKRGVGIRKLLQYAKKEPFPNCGISQLNLWPDKDL